MSHSEKVNKDNNSVQGAGPEYETENSGGITPTIATNAIVQNKKNLISDESEKGQNEKNAQSFINHSSYILAQRKRINSIFNNPLQKKNITTSSHKDTKGLPVSLKTGIENLSGFSMDDVKVHYNSPKPQQLDALAFAQGTDIHIGSGQEKHLPHEAWHVVQQKQGKVKPSILEKGENINDDASLENEADKMGNLAAENKNRKTSQLKKITGNASDAIIQQRRIPPMGMDKRDGLVDILTDIEANPSDLFLPLKEVDSENAAAHQDGMLQLLKRTFEELTPDERQKVKAEALQTLSPQDFKKLPRREQLLRFANAIHNQHPEFALKDTALINVAPEKGSESAKNVKTLVRLVNAVYTEIASGKHDKTIKDVFGKDSIGIAKRKYANGKKRLNELHRTNKITTDRSGYSEEAHFGGQADSNGILLEPEVIDNPTAAHSQLVLFHESMHAGNEDVVDQAYLGSPSFKELSLDKKLTNAAHFDVVIQRKLQGDNPNYDGVFTPVERTETVSPMKEGLRNAYDVVQKAWIIAVNLHSILARINKKPKIWNDVRSTGFTYAECIPFWSKVTNLTIHNKSKIDPNGDVSVEPVSLIDIALIEGFIRKLAFIMDQIPGEPEKLSDLSLEDPEIQIRVAIDPVFAKEWIITNFTSKVRNLTGDKDRDLRAIMRLGTTQLSMSDILKKRDPSEFS